MASIPVQADEVLEAPAAVAIVAGDESSNDVEMGTIPVIQLTCDSSETLATVASDDSGDIESAEVVVQTPPGDDGIISALDLASAPIAYQVFGEQHEQTPPSDCQRGTGSQREHNHDSSSSEFSSRSLRLPLQRRRAEFISATVMKPTKDTSIGMALVNNNGDVVISSISPDSIVASTPFRVGDRLLSVNTKRCYVMESKDAEDLMAALEGQVTIVVHHEGGDPNLVESMVTKPSDACRCGLGLASAGGRGLKISHIDAGGLFFDSLLNVGDPVVSINDQDCELCDAEHAAEMIVKAGRLITIKAKTLLETGVVVAAFSCSNNSTRSITAPPEGVNQTEVEHPSKEQLACRGKAMIVALILVFFLMWLIM
jgi:predicted metalloprotease with PDZ domain